MYKLIAGREGSGKTKRIIDMANDHVKTASGDIVYIDDDKHHMLEVSHKLRFIAMDQFPIMTIDQFYGFLCGMISNNYDMEAIYIDGLERIARCELKDFEDFIQRTEILSKEFNITFIYTLPGKAEEVSEAMRANII